MSYAQALRSGPFERAGNRNDLMYDCCGPVRDSGNDRDSVVTTRRDAVVSVKAGSSRNGLASGVAASGHGDPGLIGTCNSLLELGFNTDQVREMVVAVLGKSAAVVDSAMRGEALSTEASTISARSAKRTEYLEEVDSYALRDGYCYLWMLRGSRRKEASELFGASPSLSELRQVPSAMLAKREWCKVRVSRMSSDMHDYHLWWGPSGLGDPGDPTFEQVMRATQDEFPGMLPAKWSVALTVPRSADPLPLVARLGLRDSGASQDGQAEGAVVDAMDNGLVALNARSVWHEGDAVDAAGSVALAEGKTVDFRVRRNCYFLFTGATKLDFGGVSVSVSGTTLLLRSLLDFSVRAVGSDCSVSCVPVSRRLDREWKSRFEDCSSSGLRLALTSRSFVVMRADARSAASSAVGFSLRTWQEVHDDLDVDRKVDKYRVRDARRLREYPAYGFSICSKVSVERSGGLLVVGRFELHLDNEVAGNVCAFYGGSYEVACVGTGRVSLTVSVVYDDYNFDEGGPSDSDSWDVDAWQLGKPKEEGVRLFM